MSVIGAIPHDCLFSSNHCLFLFDFSCVISLFKKCPEAQVLFGFPLDIYPDASMLLDSHRFLMHATFLIEMIDMTINILGEDNEKLKKTMTDIGKKHASKS